MCWKPALIALGLAVAVGLTAAEAADLPAVSGSPGPAPAAAPQPSPAGAGWVDFARLNWVDRAAAQTALAPMFGDNPGLWPDWLEPRAALIPSGRNTLLVVRAPMHAPCGQYGFFVFGPAKADATRDRLEGEFCAGELSVVPVGGQVMPDLLFSEGHQQDPSGAWLRRDQRVRWSGKGWLLVKTG